MDTKAATERTKAITLNTGITNERLVMYAKNKDPDNFYANFVADQVQSSMFVETWGNGAGGLLPADCSKKFKVKSVLDLKFDNKYGYSYT